MASTATAFSWVAAPTSAFARAEGVQCPAAWTLERTEPVQSPNEYGGLFAIAATGPGRAWAVGYQHFGDGGARPLMQHRDAGGWSHVPAPASRHTLLRAVSAVTDADVWAVGSGSLFAVAEHWDGNRWTLVSTAGFAGVHRADGCQGDLPV